MYLFTKTFGKIKTVYTPVFLTNVAADKPPSNVEDQPNQTAIPKEFYRYVLLYVLGLRYLCKKHRSVIDYLEYTET